MGGLVHVDGLPVDVLRPAQRKVDHACADRGVQPVDQHEPAHVAVLQQGRTRSAGEVEVAHPDLVERVGVAAACSKKCDVDPETFGQIARGRTVWCQLEQVGRPSSMSCSAIQTMCASNWWLAGWASAREAGVPPADVDLVGQCEGHRLLGDRLVEVSSIVTMRSTVLCRPDGTTRTRSPGRTRPPTITPEKPRKSWPGRFTHWTGIRNGPSWACCPTGTVSSNRAGSGRGTRACGGWAR